MNAILKWVESKGGWAHLIALTYTALVLAYGAVPAFAALCNSVYGLAPAWAHEIMLAALGLAAWYKTTQAAPAPPAQ